MFWNIPFVDLPGFLSTCCTFVQVDGVTHCENHNDSTCGFVGSGTCLIDSKASSDCGCSNSIPIEKAIDACDLFGSAYTHLSKESLNLFGTPCNS
jgi:hypothetical protein